MRFCEYENVYLIGRVIGILDREEVARQTDVERYMDLHSDFD